MTSKRQLGGNLGHLKANLRPRTGQDSFGSQGPGGMREAGFDSISNVTNHFCKSFLRDLTLRAAAAGFSPQSGAPAAA